MRLFKQELPTFAGLILGIVPISVLLFGLQRTWLWQVALLEYVLGLLMMGLFTLIMAKRHNHGRNAVIANIIFSVFVAFLWWALWGMLIGELLEEKRTSVLNGSHA